MKEKAGNTTNDFGDTLEIHLYKGDGYNDFTLYEDDGISFNHEEGIFAKRKIAYSPEKNEFIIQQQEGTFTSPYQKVTIYFHGFQGLTNIKLNGSPQLTTWKEYRFVNQISNYDPVNTMPEGPKINLPFISTSYHTNQIVITW